MREFWNKMPNNLGYISDKNHKNKKTDKIKVKRRIIKNQTEKYDKPPDSLETNCMCMHKSQLHKTNNICSVKVFMMLTYK
jgi:hypothetical protein